MVLLDDAKFYTAKVLKQALHSPLFSVSLVLNYAQNFFFIFLEAESNIYQYAD